MHLTFVYRLGFSAFSKTFVFKSDKVLLINTSSKVFFFLQHLNWMEVSNVKFQNIIQRLKWDHDQGQHHISTIYVIENRFVCEGRNQNQFSDMFSDGLRIKLLVVCCYQSLFWWQRQIRLVGHKSVCEILLWRRNYIIQTFHWQFLAFVRKDRGHRMEEIRKHL